MKKSIPEIIQGGMGAGVSGWRLAQAVSSLGQLGVVSGTGLDQIMVRRLQSGDPGEHVRRALSHFPFQEIARKIIDSLYIPGGKPVTTLFKTTGMHAIETRKWPQSLCIAANFVEVYLAREGHDNPVGINYLEKIQLPHLPSLYGAMLAGVSVIIVGAGIPAQFPDAIEHLVEHSVAQYMIDVSGSKPAEDARMTFDPALFFDAGATAPAPLSRPYFLPIVSSHTLATMLHRRAPQAIAGFIVEGSQAGGHNAPPRGKMQMNEQGEPVYGVRDEVDLEAIQKLGVPFWLAGMYGSHEGLQRAKDLGAAGIQVGTAFALCTESGMDPEVRRVLIAKALQGKARVFTDIHASPTGFPFKVAELEHSLSDETVYLQRQRTCDLGFLRQAYRRPDGTIGYRCPAEPVAAYLSKGGKEDDTHGRKCLCNALVSNIGLPQTLPNGETERCLITLGDDFASIERFCHPGSTDYTAADVIERLLKG